MSVSRQELVAPGEQPARRCGAVASRRGVGSADPPPAEVGRLGLAGGGEELGGGAVHGHGSLAAEPVGGGRHRADGRLEQLAILRGAPVLDQSHERHPGLDMERLRVDEPHRARPAGSWWPNRPRARTSVAPSSSARRSSLRSARTASPAAGSGSSLRRPAPRWASHPATTASASGSSPGSASPPSTSRRRAVCASGNTKADSARPPRERCSPVHPVAPPSASTSSSDAAVRDGGAERRCRSRGRCAPFGRRGRSGSPRRRRGRHPVASGCDSRSRRRRRRPRRRSGRRRRGARPGRRARATTSPRPTSRRAGAGIGTRASRPPARPSPRRPARPSAPTSAGPGRRPAHTDRPSPAPSRRACRATPPGRAGHSRRFERRRRPR